MKFVTVKNVAAILNIGPQSVYNLISDGSLKAFKFGGNWRISEDDLRSYIRSCSNSAHSPTGDGSTTSPDSEVV